MGEEDSKQLLLSESAKESQNPGIRSYSSFIADEDDISPITGVGVESKKLWYLAGPAIFTTLCQYSLGAVTQLFAGHVSTITIAAFSVENNVIGGFSMGFMLGVYMQRSWIILNSSALILTLLYVFSAPLLSLIGQTTSVADAAGMFAIWMIPRVFAYAFNYPITKFLQSQSKILVMAGIAFVALVLHTVFSWLLMLKLGWGLVGAAIVLNASWWFIVVTQLGYIFAGSCGRAWSGFSFKAFQYLWGFLRLSFASAIMICLEVWYFMALILFAGYLKNAEISIDALSICMNILGWTVTVKFGFNAAISVRVSNELGAAHPRTAKFAVAAAVINSFTMGLILSALLIILHGIYPSQFTSSTEVKDLVYELTPLLATTIILNNIQPVLSASVAYVNIGCYYVFGLPVGLILGFLLGMGVRGIW